MPASDDDGAILNDAAPSGFGYPNVEGAFVVQPEGAKPLVVGGLEPVAVISGDPSDLLLALWRRLPIGQFVTNGEPETATAYLDTIAFG